MPTRFKYLNHKDKCTVWFVNERVNGLSYHLQQGEEGHCRQELNDIVHRLYLDCKTDEKNVVAYKGGHVERDVLDAINVDSFNLERRVAPNLM